MPRNTTRKARLAEFTRRELLELRICDLGLKLAGTWAADRVDQLHDELDARGLRFKPHAWLSSEWFSPDGVPGIAIPFYLAAPRLMRLEKRMMLEVEGGTDKSCMRLLRHEAGHAMSTAFRLHFRRRWQQTFGSVRQPYPESYVPRARSRNHVLHLDWWYAQAHPAEDFAETFAVWLKPGSRWRKTYEGWPALTKLEYVDELMAEIAGRAPVVRSRRHVEPLAGDRRTLATFYEEKQGRYGNTGTLIFDKELRALFSDDPRHQNRESAAAFLRRMRPHVRKTVARWTGESAYTVDLVVGEMTERARELKLRRVSTELRAREDLIVLVAVQATKLLHRVPHPILL
ncbi:hypothetical protein DRQ53_03875 [bacterium]|nr:MAG: hypothetical protein DRQ32_12045 [bacterium]RKZ17319.1 MAG: hypothetical protein DRQ53_03875 [bacterium]